MVKGRMLASPGIRLDHSNDTYSEMATVKNSVDRREEFNLCVLFRVGILSTDCKRQIQMD
jgi:hypothetical protein